MKEFISQVQISNSRHIKYSTLPYTFQCQISGDDLISLVGPTGASSINKQGSV